MLTHRQVCLSLIALVSFALSSCAPPEPIHIAYLGGLSGRVTDLGLGGRNGARLAVDLRNQKGGIKGRQIILIEADDEQDPQIAQQAVERLLEQQVQAIIGPMTSDMAIATVPVINRAQVVMLSPTVTANDLTGLDDYFFRIIPPTRHFTSTVSDHAYRTAGLRRIRTIQDLRNRSYTESWRHDFSSGFAAAGGQLLNPLAFTSGKAVDFAALARRALSGNPDGIYLIANSVDASMLCRSIRALNPTIMIGTSEWAATERLIEIGGESVEGILVAQFINRQSSAPDYIAFRDTYIKRFHQEPGFAGTLAFDATNVILDALESKTPGQPLKQTLLALKSFRGVQNPIVLDAYGDTQGQTFMVTVKDGNFSPVRTAP